MTTLTRKQMKRPLQLEPEEHELLAELGRARPRTRADCVNGARPCVFLSCRYNLYIDVTAAGSIKLNFPELELHELAETCALDVADKHGTTLEHVGSLMNLTRERIRQVEVRAAVKLGTELE